MPVAVRHSRGFTLLEILVVVMLMGLLTAVIATRGNWSSSDRGIDQAYARLGDTIGLLNERSLFSGQLMALRVSYNGWEPLIYDRVEGRFLALDETSLKRRDLPPSLALEWQLDTLEDEQISLKDVARSLVEEERMLDTGAGLEEQEDQPRDDTRADEVDEDAFPQVFFFPSGEVTPITFSLYPVEDDEQLQRLQVTALGRIFDPDAEQTDKDNVEYRRPEGDPQ